MTHLLEWDWIANLAGPHIFTLWMQELVKRLFNHWTINLKKKKKRKEKTIEDAILKGDLVYLYMIAASSRTEEVSISSLFNLEEHSHSW